MKSIYLYTLFILLSVGLTGCDEPRKTPPNVNTAFVHAAPSQGQIRFLREESLASELNYRESLTNSFNVDSYDWHFEIAGAVDLPSRPVSFSYDLVASFDYHIIAAELGGSLQEIILEFPALASDAANSEVAALHAASLQNSLNLYVEPTGTDPVSATPLGTLNLGENFAPRPVTPGDYEVIVTEAANPSVVLLRSTNFALGGGASALFTIVSGAGHGFAPVAITASGDVSFTFVDQNLDSRFRVINGISDQSALDIAIDSNFTPPLISGLAFGTVSGYEAIDPGLRTVTATPIGNPGVIQVEDEISADAGTFGTLFIANAPGTASTIFSIDDRRPVAGQGRINLYNAAVLFQFLDVYIAAPGTDINTVPPTAGLIPGASTANIALAAGTHEITVRTGGTTTVLAGPTTFTVDSGGFYGIIITDAPGGATVDLVLIDDFL